MAPAFTLVELLVVVAIIGLLTTIAIPNLLQANIRAKVSAAKSDQRTLADALEMYHVDRGTYPEDYAEILLVGEYGMGRLTTPISYLSALPHDVFGGYISVENSKHVISYTLGTAPDANPVRWMLTSSGPNGIDETSPAFDYPGYFPGLFDRPLGRYFYLRYDPTNGVVSTGDIIRVSDAQIVD